MDAEKRCMAGDHPPADPRRNGIHRESPARPNGIQPLAGRPPRRYHDDAAALSDAESDVEHDNDEHDNDEHPRAPASPRALADPALALQLALWSALTTAVLLVLLGVLYRPAFADWLRRRHARVARFVFDLYRSLIVTGITVLVGYVMSPVAGGAAAGSRRRGHGRRPLPPRRSVLGVVLRALAAPVALIVTTWAVWETREDALALPAPARA